MPVKGWTQTRIGEFAWEVSDKSRGTEEVLSCTKHRGFVPSLEYFGKQVFSKETSSYKLVRRGQYAYATIHLDEGSIDCLTIRDEGIISPMYTVFDVDDAQVDRDFLLELLQTPAMLNRYGAIGQGSVNRRKSISFDTLALETIQLPPLPEQKKIAAILSSVDEAIQATEAVIEQTRRVKDGLLQDLLTRGIGHTRFKQTEIGEIPESWEVRELRTLGLVDCGKAKSKHQDSPMRQYLRVANVLDDEINDSDVMSMPFSDAEFEKWRLEPGDILLNEGQSLELVGRPAVYRGSPPNVAMQNALLRWRPDPSAVSPEFGYQVVRSLYITGKLSQISTQTTSIAHLGLKRFAGIRIAVPPLQEQRQIASILKAVDQQRRESEATVHRLRQVKAGLLQDLLTGAVRVSA